MSQNTAYAIKKTHFEKMAQLANISVLIVDEDALIPSITRNVLESFGFRKIFHVKTAESALESLSNKKIDLIISEWPMCPENDVNIVQYIRNQNTPYRRIPIILLTGKGDVKTIRKARDGGMTEFLVKPFRVDTLCDRIVSVVEKPRKFVVSGRYTGPDRRRRALKIGSDRRGKIPEEDKTVTRKGNLEIVEYKGNKVIVADEDYSIKEKMVGNFALSDIFTEDAIKAAEDIIDESSDSFMEDVSGLLQELETHYDAVYADFTDMESLENACWCALSIKAKAGIFGFNLASRIAKLLHDYTEEMTSIAPSNVTVMREHIDTLKVIFHQKLKVDVDNDEMSKTLLDYLQKLAIRYPADGDD